MPQVLPRAAEEGQGRVEGEEEEGEDRLVEPPQQHHPVCRYRAPLPQAGQGRVPSQFDAHIQQAQPRQAQERLVGVLKAVM